MNSFLYHYTNIVGMTGNKKKKEDCISLWFTHSMFLNDSSEGYDIDRVYPAACKNLLSNGEIDKKEYEELGKLKITDKFIFDFYDSDRTLHIKELPYDTYICSLSYDPDSLGMWRYYTKGETGLSIGLNKGLLSNSASFKKNNENRIGKFEVADVIYDEKVKRYLVEEGIKNAIRNPDPQNGLRGSLNTNLYKYKYIFKHPCFQNENEVRMLLFVPKDPSSLIKYGQSPYKILYRTSNGMLIPYIKLSFPKETLFSVQLSPLSSETNIISVGQYISGFKKNVRIEKSSLPVRF